MNQIPLITTTTGKWASAPSTFVYNMQLPVHGWFRFSAGFSAEWAANVIESAKPRDEAVVLDPFAGVATTLLAGEEVGVASMGIEAQPFVARVGEAKLLWHADVERFLSLALTVLKKAKNSEATTSEYPPLIHKCYPPGVLRDLHRLKLAWQEEDRGDEASRLVWLALASILRVSSPVGTAPWQYVLPGKSKTKHVLPYKAFEVQMERMAHDMTMRQSAGVMPKSKIVLGDARDCSTITSASVNLVVTSPPYPNNFDYADATRLEMSFFGEVRGWGDLQDVARRNLIVSCSQHASVVGVPLEETLADLARTRIHAEITRVCRTLEEERLSHGGKKDYHLMVAAYFSDMKRVWASLRRVCQPKSVVCFVVGDSAPYGVYVPVDRWLGDLALDSGFAWYTFERTRDRNVKWRNRKHRVPLHEGRLWVYG